MVKLLTVAGMDLNEDLADGSLMETIGEVLKNFDPNKTMTDNDHAFTARMTKFQ